MRRWAFGGMASILSLAIVAAFVAGCMVPGMMKSETPVSEEASQTAEVPPEAEAPATESAPKADTAVAASQVGAAPVDPASVTEEPKPATPPAPVLQGAAAERFKNIDPSLLIYLSGRGVLAGTGDPSKVAGDAEKAGAKEHPAALEFSGLPKDQYGLIDWATAIKSGKIKPLDSLDPSVPAMPPFNLDIVIKAKSNFMPDVVYPHYTHTLWLTCVNCHTQIFNMKAGGNPDMTMPKIAAGEYCGRCHNRVAFPLSDCTRCHVKPKEASGTGKQP